jgi:hypothetical protein
METQVGTARSRLLLVRELVDRVVQDLVIRDSAHPQAVVADMVLLLAASCVLGVAHLVDGHLVLRAASCATRLLAVTFVAMSIVSVPVMPIMPVTSMPVHRSRSMRSTTSTVASMTAVPSDDVRAEIEPIAAVWIRPRVRVAVVPVVSDDALDPLVCLLRCLAVVRAVTCSRGPGSESEAVDSVVEAAHRPMRRQNVSLAPSDL